MRRGEQLRAEAQRANAGSGSKLASSRHQIGTLYANAKANELRALEGGGPARVKTKRETGFKYGW